MPPLIALLESPVANVQVAACVAIEGLASHPEAREMLLSAGALHPLLKLARDELHPAHDEAAAALAQVGGHGSAAHDGAAGDPAVSFVVMDGGAEVTAEAVRSFVAMASRGPRASRLQAAIGMRHLCGVGANRRKLVDAGAVRALLCCCNFWEQAVRHAAVSALAALTREPLAALQLMRVSALGDSVDERVQAAAGVMAWEGRSGMDAVLHFLAHSDGAVRLAAAQIYANLCAQPANGPLLLADDALGRLCASLGGGASAEEKAVGMQGLASLCTHNTPSAAQLARADLLPRLVAFARARQAPPRHLPAPELSRPRARVETPLSAAGVRGADRERAAQGARARHPLRAVRAPLSAGASPSPLRTPPRSRGPPSA